MFSREAGQRVEVNAFDVADLGGRYRMPVQSVADGRGPVLRIAFERIGTSRSIVCRVSSAMLRVTCPLCTSAATWWMK